MFHSNWPPLYPNLVQLPLWRSAGVHIFGSLRSLPPSSRMLGIQWSLNVCPFTIPRYPSLMFHYLSVCFSWLPQHLESPDLASHIADSLNLKYFCVSNFTQSFFWFCKNLQIEWDRKVEFWTTIFDSSSLLNQSCYMFPWDGNDSLIPIFPCHKNWDWTSLTSVWYSYTTAWWPIQ